MPAERERDTCIIVYIVYISAIKRDERRVLSTHVSPHAHSRVVNNFPKCPPNCSHALVTRRTVGGKEKQKAKRERERELDISFSRRDRSRRLNPRLRLVRSVPRRFVFTSTFHLRALFHDVAAAAAFTRRAGRRDRAARRGAAGGGIAKSPWK